MSRRRNECSATPSSFLSQSSVASSTLSNRSSTGPPRFDKTQRLLSRFYEPLILLGVLGKPRSDLPSAPYPKGSDTRGWSIKHVRRLFLRELAYLCDHQTGGDSVTAISVSVNPQRRTFWVAANSCPDHRILPFLQSLLTNLRSYRDEEVDARQVTEICLGYARRRNEAYLRFLKKAIEKVTSRLTSEEEDGEECMYRQNPYPAAYDTNRVTDRGLLRLLRRFSNMQTVNYENCRFAEQSSHSPEVNLLKRLSADTHFATDPDSPKQAFKLIRHYIGRLGYHIKAVRNLVSLLSRLPNIVDDFEIRSLPTLPRSLAPQPDRKTNLASMIGRVLPAGSDDLESYRRILSEMDEMMNLDALFLHAFTDRNFKPRAHAECQLLDHHLNAKVAFEDDDPYVACSKPACYCCYRYFKHHPLQPTLPATYQNIHRNWKPPFAEAGAITKAQSDILNRMVQDIRHELLRQLDTKQLRRSRVLDSTTGITSSLYSLQEEEAIWDEVSDLSDWQSDFGDLHDDAASTHSLHDSSDLTIVDVNVADVEGLPRDESVQALVEGFGRHLNLDDDDDEDEEGGVSLT